MESMILILGRHLLHNLSWFTLASLFLLTALEANTKPSNQNELCRNLTDPNPFDKKRSTSGSYSPFSTGEWFDINCSTSYRPKKWLSGEINREDEVVLLSPTQVYTNQLMRGRDKTSHYSLRKLKHHIKNGRGNIPHIKDFPVKFILGLGFSFLFLISGVYFSVKKHKFITLKSKFFQKNGGLLLEQHIASHGIGSTQIFTTKELEMAIDCYKESHIFGPRDTKEAEQDQMERFINKIVTLIQLNHQNVVKFLGCCLETEAPILVYELASKGTLFNYIHHTNGKSSLPWDTLLRIASESAAALAYLHSSAAYSSKPLIIHGNVNSSNILLNDCFEAKVAGFGPSRLAPVNESQVSTLAQRTIGYLDPEYFCTGQLTDKSDVYSFGVVLLELLTGEKPISFDRPEDQRIITSHFVLSMEQNLLFQIVAPQLVNEGNREQVRAVAELAKRCLKLSGAGRPAMEQVAGELKRLSDTYNPT